MISGEWVCRNAFHVLSNVSLEGLPYAVSVGVHPWHAHFFSSTKDKLIPLFANKKAVAIGEIGLDKVCPVPFAVQEKAFSQQIDWAHTVHKPLIIHCVRSYYEVYAYLRHSALPFLLHGFQGSLNELDLFLSMPNSYFSFGRQLFHKGKAQTAFLQVPVDRFFLETDNSSFRINQIYQQASKLRPALKPLLAHQLQQNRDHFFQFN